MIRRLWAIAGTAAALPAQQPSPGQIIDGVARPKDQGQRYALYLPSSYTPQLARALILAVEPYHPAVEKFGYIITGANVSRGGLWPVSMAAEFLRIDEQHTYTASSDFNRLDMRSLRQAITAPHRVAVFEGGHVWLPGERAVEAVLRLDLGAPQRTRAIKDVRKEEQTVETRERCVPGGILALQRELNIAAKRSEAYAPLQGHRTRLTSQPTAGAGSPSRRSARCVSRAFAMDAAERTKYAHCLRLLTAFLRPARKGTR
jgi:hypothetical protein